MLSANNNNRRSGPRGGAVGFFRQTGGIWLGVAGISTILNLLMLTGPIFMLQVYDRVLSSGSVPTLVVLAVLAFSLYCFYGLLDLLRSRILLRTGQYVDTKLSDDVFRISTAAPVLIGPKAAKLRPVHDLDTVRQFLSGPGPSALCDTPWMPFYLLIVYLFHPILGLVGLCGGLLICLLIGLNEWTSKGPTREATAEASTRQMMVDAARNNSEAVKAMGMVGALQMRWKEKNSGYLSKQRYAADRTTLFSVLTKTIRFILQSAMLGFGAWLTIRQEVSGGVMIAGSIMISRALSPIEIAVSQWRGFVSARQAYARLSDILGKMPNHMVQMELPLPEKALSVEQMSCAPVGVRKPVVQGVSLDLEAGQGLGIIGPSGSGKSTLAKTLVGVNPALAGSVRLDGSELAHWSEDQHSRIIGFLPQDVQIFDGTVAENISRFSKDADPNTIIEAAQLADLHDMISHLPEGYNTQIGASGFALSGGQKQRIALARALYGNPFLIVLDEPNSNLDSQGEAALGRALIAMKEKGSIVIVIAHRPSALVAVDMVLCLDEGKMKAFGPKNEVLSKVLAPVKTQGVA
ncbi:type I secretion system permease/ATPase [uncultured Cohaesibacter sp.]|uniref:type I secretion system permease/ATPase n=1 Tax=uncultured Cohaesibacter sp. TaxID=1002546 RepID=UPI002931C173|nr:type I secretion system permease/ATPase [uncultured Cohaesibacter sp.]